jgi:hypothetical protein
MDMPDSIEWLGTNTTPMERFPLTHLPNTPLMIKTPALYIPCPITLYTPTEKWEFHIFRFIQI